MPDFVLEDALYTSRWKRAFLWNFFLLGLLTPFFVVLGHHLSQQPNPVTNMKGRGYKNGGIASFIALAATYLMLAIAIPAITGMSLGEAARFGAAAASRGCRATGDWVASLWRAPEKTAAQEAEKLRREAEAREKEEALERQRVLAEKLAAEEKALKELELKRQQTPSAIVAPRKTTEENEETRELARFDAEQKQKKMELETRAAAQDARRAAQTAATLLNEAELAARKAKAVLRSSEYELGGAQQRIATLDSQQPRPANYGPMRKMYQEAEETEKRRVADARAAMKTAEQALARAQSVEAAARTKAEAFGPVEPPKAKPAGPVLNVYCLKDGREISAVKVVDLGDSYGLKDDAGKLTTVKKTEVWDIREP